jgi:hypothetical protein
VPSAVISTMCSVSSPWWIEGLAAVRGSQTACWMITGGKRCRLKDIEFVRGP